MGIMKDNGRPCAVVGCWERRVQLAGFEGAVGFRMVLLERAMAMPLDSASKKKEASKECEEGVNGASRLIKF